MAMTKATAIDVIVTNDETWTPDELADFSVAALRKMAAKYADKVEAPATLTRDDKIAAIIDSGKFPMFDSEDLEDMTDKALDKFHAKIGDATGKTTRNGAPKVTLPVKPNLTTGESVIRERILTFLKDVKVMPAGHHPYPKTRTGESWQASTVYNNALEALTDHGFAHADQWATLFLDGSLDALEFAKVIKHPMLDNRMKSSRAK